MLLHEEGDFISTLVEEPREALSVVAQEHKYLLMVEPPAYERSLSFIQEIEAKNWTQFYALEKGAVVGWCDVIPYEREGITHVGCLGMGVLPEYRGQGIGELLLTTCIRDTFYNAERAA